MQGRIIVAKKVEKAKLVWAIARGRSPFRGARTATGGKDPKDLRGIKGLLLKSAQDREARLHD